VLLRVWDRLSLEYFVGSGAPGQKNYADQLENLRQQNILSGGLATKLEELRRRNPKLPSDPMRFVTNLNDAFKRIEQLEAELSQAQPQDLTAKVQSLQEDLYETKFILDATDQQLARAHKQIENQFDKIRSGGHELAELKRAKDALQEQASGLRQEVMKLTRAICDREADLAADFAKRFPHTLKALEAVAFRELTDETENARQATSSAERRLNLMHRGLEELCQDHPELTVGKKVMHLFLGEEPPDEPAVSRRKPTGLAADPDEFDAVFQEMEREPPSARVPRVAPAKSEPCPARAEPSIRSTISFEPNAPPPALPWGEYFDEFEEPSATPTLIPSAPMPPPFPQKPSQPSSNDDDDGEWVNDDDLEPVKPQK